MKTDINKHKMTDFTGLLNNVHPKYFMLQPTSFPNSSRQHRSPYCWTAAWSSSSQPTIQRIPIPFGQLTFHLLAPFPGSPDGRLLLLRQYYGPARHRVSPPYHQCLARYDTGAQAGKLLLLRGGDGLLEQVAVHIVVDDLPEARG